jgi:hypothetical protein
MLAIRHHPCGLRVLIDRLSVDGGASSLEVAARLAAMPGCIAAYALGIERLLTVAHALTKRGSFKLLKRLVCASKLAAFRLPKHHPERQDYTQLGQAILARACDGQAARPAPKAVRRLAETLGLSLTSGRIGSNPNPIPTSGVPESRQTTVSLPKLPLDCSVCVVDRLPQLQAALGPLCDEAREEGFLGLDTEWADPEPSTACRAGQGGAVVVLLQVASRSYAVLARLHLLGSIGTQEAAATDDDDGEPEHDGLRVLREILMDEAIVKAGVGIARDAAMLRDQHGLECKRIVDLVDMACAVGVAGPSRHGLGLASLTRLTLQHELPKPKHLRCGDWRVEPLTQAQVEYAALDAIAGRRIFAVLQERSP